MVVRNNTQDVESRFGHLLQPIRDLTKNWNVDIASELEDYLEEVEKISITFDDGMTTMNFAEAALLIQGSTCIYSKKVEYLYTLVYQVLDLLTSKKKLQQASSVDGQGRDKDATFHRNKQDDDEFLTLDDTKRAKSIDFLLSEETSEGVSSVPQTPILLLPQGEKHRKDKPLLSVKGEVLGNHQDFKLNTCCIFNETGTLLLDKSHKSLIAVTILSKPSLTQVTTEVSVHEVQCSSPPAVCEAGHSESVHVENLLMDITTDGAGEEMCDAVEGYTSVLEHTKREMAQRKPQPQKKPYLMPPKMPTVNPWEELDPHQSVPGDKLFKKSKVFKVPSNLETRRKKKRKRNEFADKEITPITEYCVNMFFSQAKNFPRNPLKAPTFLEFEHHFWKEYRRRKAINQREKQKLVSQGRLQEVCEEEEAAQQEAACQVDDDVDNDDDNEVFPEIHVPEIHLSNHIDGSIRDMEDTEIVTTYEEMVKQYVDGYMSGAQEYAQVTGLSKRVHEWEDKIMPKLKQEESHSVFDIHDYGTKVLNTMNTEAPSTSQSEFIPFRKIVENKESFEVCRTFLATLQLANSYNVEIQTCGALEEGMDTMSLKILSTRRQFEELLDYRAPSLQKT